MNTPLPGRARGATLLVLLAIVAVVVLSMLLGVVGKLDRRTANLSRTDRSLAEGRSALLAWAATHPGLPGKLPCPENTALIGSASEGTALATCTLPAKGRLPWRTLGVPRLLDANGEPLWYALSAGFGEAKINSATPAQLTVDGIGASAVAIVIAPGVRLPGQVRPALNSTSPRDPADYLEGGNQVAGNSFVSSTSGGNFNDRLLLLTRGDLMYEVETRVLAEMAQRLRAYYAANRYFPYASATGAGACAAGLLLNFLPQGAGTCSHPVFPATAMPAWYVANDWALHVNYEVAPGCVALTPGSGADCGGAGRLTVGSDTAVRATLKTPHRPTTIVAP